MEWGSHVHSLNPSIPTEGVHVIKTVVQYSECTWLPAHLLAQPLFLVGLQEAGKAVKSQLPSNLGETTKGASDALGAVTPFFNKFVQVSSP